MVVFVDTSAFYALANAADPNHRRAVTLLRGAIDAGHELLTHNYVVVESVALMHRRLGWTAAERFLQDVGAFRITWVDETVHRGAAERFRKHRGRVSLVDEVSFALMRTTGAQVVALAFDRDFAAEGFPLYEGG